MKWIGIKSGKFSIIHAGHVRCLLSCRSMCDYLIVLTNSDSYVRQKKGCCPIELDDRLFILQNIKGVDEVGHFNEVTEHWWIQKYKVNRLSEEHGEDAKIVVFHSDELQTKTNGELPGLGVADNIIFIPKVHMPESVTNIFKTIRSSS